MNRLLATTGIVFRTGRFRPGRWPLVAKKKREMRQDVPPSVVCPRFHKEEAEEAPMDRPID